MAMKTHKDIMNKIRSLSADSYSASRNPKKLIVEINTSKMIVPCDKCEGTGFKGVNTPIQKFPQNRRPQIIKCKHCDGQGRMLKTEEWLEIVDSKHTKSLEPFYESDIETIKSEHNSVVWGHYYYDSRNITMEQRHPELKALSYENYDSLLDNLEVFEAIAGIQSEEDEEDS